MVPSVVWLQHAFSSKSRFLGDSLYFLRFKMFFDSNVFSTKNPTFYVVPFTFMFPKVVWLQCVAQNQYFGLFPSLFLVLCVVWLQSVFRSKSLFWVIPVLFLWFPVLFGFKVIHFFFVVTSAVKFQGMVSKGFPPLFQSDSHNIIMIKLNGFFRIIHKYIGLAMSFEKIVLGIRLAQFLAKTHSLTNIFVYHT